VPRRHPWRRIADAGGKSVEKSLDTAPKSARATSHLARLFPDDSLIERNRKLNGTEIPLPAPKKTKPKSKPGEANRWAFPAATYMPPLEDGGRLRSTAAGTVNCPAESGAVRMKYA
jgi:hypothetical protein